MKYLSKIEFKNFGVSILLITNLSLVSQSGHSDLVQLDSYSYVPDRLEQLSKTLSQGNYTHPDNMEIPGSVVFRPDLKENNDEELSYQRVLPEDFKKLKLKPLFKDSEVSYSFKHKDYSETKYFPNNVLMIYDLETKVATIVDMDNDQPVKNGWSVACKQDHITDEKSCFISKFDLMIIRTSKYGVGLSVTKEPEKLSFAKYHYIRIDKNPPFKTKSVFWGQPAVNIINQMQKGSMAYTRFYDWSDSYEESISLYGFSAAYQIMNIMYSR